MTVMQDHDAQRHLLELRRTFGCDFRLEEFSHEFHPPVEGEWRPNDFTRCLLWDNAPGPVCHAMSALEVDHRGWEYPVAFGWGETRPVRLAAKWLLWMRHLPGLWIDPCVPRSGDRQRHQRTGPESLSLAIGWPAHYFDPVRVTCQCWIADNAKQLSDPETKVATV